MFKTHCREYWNESGGIVAEYTTVGVGFLKYRPLHEHFSSSSFFFCGSHRRRRIIIIGLMAPSGPGGRRSKTRNDFVRRTKIDGAAPSPLTTGAISGRFYCHPPVIGYLLSNAQIPPFFGQWRSFSTRNLLPTTWFIQMTARCWWQSIELHYSSW